MSNSLKPFFVFHRIAMTGTRETTNFQVVTSRHGATLSHSNRQLHGDILGNCRIKINPYFVIYKDRDWVGGINRSSTRAAGN